MTKEIATPKQTSGKGFTFEDKVGAYYAVRMILGRAPFEPADGLIVRMDFQVRVDGWLLDDLLMTLQSASARHRYALSIKSNPQFGSDSAPQDFVAAAWSQYLCDSADCFDPSRDMLGLITSPLPDPLRRALHDLVNRARNQDPASLVERISSPGYASDLHRSLLDSFACPTELAGKHSVTQSRVGELLGRTVFRGFDFEDIASEDEGQAISDCQQLVQDGALESATKLWHTLLEAVNEARTAGGYLDRSRLLAALRPFHQLKDFPDFETNWSLLRRWSGRTRAAVRSTIGGTIALPREDEVAQVLASLTEDGSGRTSVIIGPSGGGKTVIAKLVCERVEKDATVLWLDAGDLGQSGIEALASSLGLNHPFPDVLANFSQSKGLVVLDGLERLEGATGLRELAMLFDALAVTDLHCPWKVLITCQAERWSYLLPELASSCLPIEKTEVYQIRPLNTDDILPVLEAFPALKPLATRPALHEQPKILDLLASVVRSGGVLDVDRWVGESDLIKCYWERCISGGRNGDARSAFLQRLGERQADEGRSKTPVMSLDPAEAGLLAGLRRGGICQVDNECVAFAHDHLGDWARQRSTLAHSDDLRGYLEDRVHQPYWHGAIRFFGLHLLEQSQDTRAWRRTFDELDFVQDLLLDAVFLSTNASGLLGNVWPDLEAENGALLRRLLRRFLHVATYPDPTRIAIAEKYNEPDPAYARAQGRLPVWTYWPAVLHFLHRRLEKAVELAPLEAAEIAGTWLKAAGANWPCRDEAARVALAVGTATYEKRKHHPYREIEDDRACYEALLQAARMLPDDVANLALKASARRIPTDVASGEVGDYRRPGTVEERSSSLGTYELTWPDPWPDGPSFSVDEAFRHVCLHTEAILPLMVKRPRTTSEVILALLIRKPRPKGHPSRYHMPIGRQLEVHDDSRFHPRFYFQGPFLSFLQVNPECGLDAIIRLVDFATERWAEEIRAEGEEPNIVYLSDSRRTWMLQGDWRVFYWYRGAVWYSDVVSSALMALEKWLYNSLDAGQPIDEVVETIFKRTTSVAFAGLLVEVGRSKPDLFRDLLGPLLCVPEFHYWEHVFQSQGAIGLGTSFMFITQEWLWNKAREWETLPHRTRQLHQILGHMVLDAPELQEHFAAARSRCQERLSGDIEDERLRTQMSVLAAYLDRGNWQQIESSDGEKVWQFVAPAELLEKAERSVAEFEPGRRSFEFTSRCYQLLEHGQPLPQEQLEPFWTALQGFDTQSTEAEKQSDTASTLACICGGIAVLARLHRDWLAQYQDREQWCLDRMREIASDPPPPGQFEYEETLNPCGWDRFLAVAVPVFWAESPDCTQYRELAAYLATQRSFEVIRILLRSAFAARDQLGSSFKQLVNLVIRFAVAYSDLHRAHQQREKTDHIVEEIGVAASTFIAGQTPSDLTPWGEQAAEEGELVYTERSRGWGRRDAAVFAKAPRIDMPLVQHAFQDIFLPSQAAEPQERSEWLGFWGQGLTCVLSFAECYDKNGNPVEEAKVGVQDLFAAYEWVFDRAVTVMLQMSPEEDPGRFWKPILSLGPRACYWVERFLGRWFLDGLRSAAPPGFVPAWQGMLDFAFDSGIWDPTSRRSWHPSCEFWSNILGIDAFASEMWKVEHQDVVTQMEPY